MNNGNRNAGEKPEGYEPLFLIGEPIIFEGESAALKNARSVDKIEPMSLQVCRAFRFGPSELHAIVYIQNVMASTAVAAV